MSVCTYLSCGREICQWLFSLYFVHYLPQESMVLTMPQLSFLALGASLLAAPTLANCAAGQGQQPCHAQAQGQGAGCAANAAWLIDPNTSKGGCCPPVGHKYFWDQQSQTGSCCPDTTVGFNGHMCIDPQYQPQTGCGDCPGGQNSNSNTNTNTNTNVNQNQNWNQHNPNPGYGNNNAGPGSPGGSGPGNSNSNQNTNINQNTNTNTNQNTNWNNPGQANPGSPGSPGGSGGPSGPGNAGPGNNNQNTNTNFNSNQNTNQNTNWNTPGQGTPGQGNPGAPGGPNGPGGNQNTNTNWNSNINNNVNNPGQGNPGAPGGPGGPGGPGNPNVPGGNQNTNNNWNSNTNINGNNPGAPGGPGGPGSPNVPGGNQNTNNNWNHNQNTNWNTPGQGNPGAPGGPGGPNGPGGNQNTNNNWNTNVNGNNPGVPGGPGGPNVPGNPAGAGGCVNVCPGSKGNGTGGACDPAELSNGCTDRICPNPAGDKIGLQYGHCYRFKNPKGEALNKRDHGFQDYVWGGYYADIYQFRICRSTTDCSKGEEISINSPFVINDQIGRSTKSSSEILFWVVELPGWHFGNSETAASAVKFTARPWVGDTCGICLKGEGKGLGPVCPASNPGVGFKENPRYCVPLIIEEVPCLEGNGNLERLNQAGQPIQAAPKGHDEL